MYSPCAHTTWKAIAITLMVSIVGIIFMHQVVAHEHGHVHTEGPAWLTMHTGLLERNQDLPLYVPLAFASLIVVLRDLRFVRASLQRGFQDIEVRTWSPLATALSGGVIHSRAY